MRIHRDKCLQLLEKKSFIGVAGGDVFRKLYRKRDNVSIKKFNKTLTEYLKKKPSRAYISADLLRYAKRTLKQDIKLSLPGKYAFILLDGKKILIRKQDYFCYRVVEYLHSTLQKAKDTNGDGKIIYDMLFEYDRHLKIDRCTGGSIENIRKVNKIRGGRESARRTDFEIKIFVNGTTNTFIIEYLENHHDSIDNYERDKFRLWDLERSNDDVAFAWMVLEKNMEKNYSDGIDNIVGNVVRCAMNIYRAADEKKYVIDNLTRITQNSRFSEMLYTSHTKKNICCVDVKQIDSFIKWKSRKKKKLYNKKFVKEYSAAPRRGANVVVSNSHLDELAGLDDDSDASSDSDTDDDSDDDINGDSYDGGHRIELDVDCNGKLIGLNFYAFQYYLIGLAGIDGRYLINSEEKKKIMKLYTLITDELINSFRKRAALIKSCHDDKYKIF